MQQRSDTSQLTTDAPQVTAQRTLPPRPPFPAPPTRTRPLSHDIQFDRAAYEASFDRFLHHADRAFGEGDDDPWLPRVPGPRQPSDYAGAA